MSVRQVQVAECDAPRCKVQLHENTKAINTETGTWVDAMVYGATFHRDCWNDMTASELAKALSLDDIELVDPQNPSAELKRTKIIYMGKFKRPERST